MLDFFKFYTQVTFDNVKDNKPLVYTVHALYVLTLAGMFAFSVSILVHYNYYVQNFKKPGVEVIHRRLVFLAIIGVTRVSCMFIHWLITVLPITNVKNLLEVDATEFGRRVTFTLLQIFWLIVVSLEIHFAISRSKDPYQKQLYNGSMTLFGIGLLILIVTLGFSKKYIPTPTQVKNTETIQKWVDEESGLTYTGDGEQEMKGMTAIRHLEKNAGSQSDNKQCLQQFLVSPDKKEITSIRKNNENNENIIQYAVPGDSDHSKDLNCIKKLTATNIQWIIK